MLYTLLLFVLVFQRDGGAGEVVVAAGDWGQYGVRIVSRNTFPTSAGLASSAAGLACLSECSQPGKGGLGPACFVLFVVDRAVQHCDPSRLR